MPDKAVLLVVVELCTLQFRRDDYSRSNIVATALFGDGAAAAIVRCGGRQEKASVDDVLTIDKLAGEVGSSVTLPAVLLVDDGKVISDPAEVGGYQVTAEIVGAAAGPKIKMIHYKNKTGHRVRKGHRQKYTQVKVTAIDAGKK